MADKTTSPKKHGAKVRDRAAASALEVAENGHHDDVARRAYQLYVARGCQDGHDVEDWLQAERELR
jgi:hypothetical protein